MASSTQRMPQRFGDKCCLSILVLGEMQQHVFDIVVKKQILVTVGILVHASWQSFSLKMQNTSPVNGTNLR